MEGMNISGFDDLLNDIDNMEISEQKEKKALKEAGEKFEKAMQDNIAVDSGYSKKQIKNRTSRNSDGDLCQKIYIDDFYYHFDEFGSSKSKKNVGKIERATDDIADDVINEAFKSILN